MNIVKANGFNPHAAAQTGVAWLFRKLLIQPL